MAEHISHNRELSPLMKRVSGALAISTVLLFPVGCSGLDGDPECGASIKLDQSHSPATFLQYDGETYSVYMPSQYLGDQEVTIVQGRMAGERDSSTPVNFSLKGTENSDVQRGGTNLPGVKDKIELVYDRTSHMLKTDCQQVN